VDRPPFWLFWEPWATTYLRWVEEGMPGNADHQRPWNPDPAPKIVPVNCGPCPTSDYTLIEEDEHTHTWYDRWGIKRRNLKGAESMSEFLEFPVKSRRDWEQLREERLDPDHSQRAAGVGALCRKWAEKGIPIQLGYYPDVGIFGSVRWMLGDEDCLITFCTDPDLIHEMMDHMTSLYLTVFEKVVQEAPIDMIHIWEDMCGRQGPLIGPQQWEEFLGPCYRRIKAFADRHNIPILSVDTDGQPDLIIPPMMDAGVNYLFPFEVAAGCDVNDFRKRYPTLGMMGGIDKRALAEGPKAIDEELERVRPAVEAGRYIPELDHTIPDNVSWENYCHYADALKKLVGKG
ncbi:MAG: hypothetical protein GWP08_19075, partial [Nitrospiraceae bacterium]|nr:hypothetical protein [Nitrospiraceae bacterium]